MIPVYSSFPLVSSNFGYEKSQGCFPGLLLLTKLAYYDIFFSVHHTNPGGAHAEEAPQWNQQCRKSPGNHAQSPAKNAGDFHG